ncbi:MFS transporter [Lysobacter korlensis]|uniref:MFS transporter n=1 Tax=Lysobacter korlensis TaxID=553636 RepID=A0ABV6RWU8_9GAMM
MAAPEASTHGTTLRGRSLAVLLIMCGAIFIEGSDVAMFNVALPTIREDLNLATGQIQWVVSAFVLGYGGFVLVGGRAADVFGRRRVFLIAMVAFIAFSALGGFATDGPMLLVARAATGIAAAFMTPAGLAIITTTFTDVAARNKAVMIYSAVGAGGFSIGLVVGGGLTMLGWRWVFFVPLALSVLLLAGTLAFVPRQIDDSGRGGRLGAVAAALLTASTVSLVVAIEQAGHGAYSIAAAVAVAAGVLGYLFAANQRRSSHPFVPANVLRDRGILRANAGAGLLAAGFLGFQFIVVLYLQEHRGWTVLQTSLAMLVMGIDLILAPTLTPRLVNRFGVRNVASVGLAFALASYLLFLPADDTWGYLLMLPSFVALGLAFTFAYGPLTIAATEPAAEADQGSASGLLYTVFQIGGAIGLALTSMLLAFADSVSVGAETYRIALLAPIALAGLGLLASVAGQAWRRPAAATRAAGRRQAAAQPDERDPGERDMPRRQSESAAEARGH